MGMSKRTLVVAVVMLVVAESSIAQGRLRGINEFCKTASKRELCTSMVKGATNWNMAVKNAVETTMGLANQMQAILPQVVSAFANLPAISKDSAAQTCQESFTNVVDNLKESLGFLAANDKGSLNSYLSASLQLSDCEESFSQFGIPVPPQLATIIRLMADQVENCLAVSQQN